MRESKFTWGAGDFSVSKCLSCKHWATGATCIAFPKGIPADILSNDHDHSNPYDGDGGVRYEAKQIRKL
jgi:hypothetical protein